MLFIAGKFFILCEVAVQKLNVISSFSNGAGRTGAYILLDLVLGRMNKGAREIDIAATLEHLRDQRAGLVATRQQFEFVLMAVAEEVSLSFFITILCTLKMKKYIFEILVFASNSI